MAIDTENRRRSVLGRRGSPHYRLVSVPDGTIDAADLRQLAGLYAYDYQGAPATEGSRPRIKIYFQIGSSES